MPVTAKKRAGLLLSVVLSIAACADDDKSTGPADSGWTGDWPDADSGHPAAPGDAGVDAAKPPNIDATIEAGGPAPAVDSTAPTARTSCLERPDAPLVAPTGALPCELLPPGTSLAP